jgi:arsenate reductase
MTISVYGLKNCDSCRAARRWLEQHNVAHEFVDIREHELDSGALARWAQATDWSILLNRRSTTWRQLADTEKQIDDADGACRLILQHPTLLKRPVLDGAGELLVGFKPADYARVLETL